MHNLKTVKELKEYSFSDYEADYGHKYLEEKVEKIHKKDLCVTGTLAVTIFEVSWQLTGMDKFFLILWKVNLLQDTFWIILPRCGGFRLNVSLKQE